MSPQASKHLVVGDRVRCEHHTGSIVEIKRDEIKIAFDDGAVLSCLLPDDLPVLEKC